MKVNPLDHNRRFEVGKCLQCGRHMDGISGQEIDPYPGAIMLCADCSYVMEWDGAKLVELSEKAMKDLAEDVGDENGLKAAIALTRAYQAWRKDPKKVRVLVLEPLPPEVCQACGKLEELRPYGKRQPNGVRQWVCMACAMKDPDEMERAFDERIEGKNPV